jgi:hypothetical protein
MSVFYCDFHGVLEDSDEVGFNEWGDESICDEALEDYYALGEKLDEMDADMEVE